jgi:predicted alpha/beta superfamily hydrolase
MGPVQFARSLRLSAGPHALPLFVAWPEQQPPPEGFPLLLLLDGEANFGTAVEAARTQSRRPEVTRVPPAVIAAVVHRDTAEDARQRDFLPPGSDAFLDLLQAEILPAISDCVPCDPARRAIFGHSFSGLLVLRALFSRPLLFSRYVAASPSLWWNDREALGDADHFLANPPPEASRLRLLLTAGGLESDDPMADEARRAKLRERALRANIQELARRLAVLGPRGPTVDIAEFPGENHASVIPAAVSRALRFALEP